MTDLQESRSEVSRSESWFCLGHVFVSVTQQQLPIGMCRYVTLFVILKTVLYHIRFAKLYLRFLMIIAIIIFFALTLEGHEARRDRKADEISKIF